jgi:hypothetical protein
MVAHRHEQLVTASFEVHFGRRHQWQGQRQEISLVVGLHGHTKYRRQRQDIANLTRASLRQRCERVRAHRFVRKVGGDHDRQRLEGVSDLGQASLLGLVPAGQPRGVGRLLVGLGEDPVDDDLVNRKAIEPQGGQRPPRLGNDHALWGEDQTN